MGNVLHDPNHWRQRAEETRTKAEGFRLAERERERLLKVAAEYDQIAARAERWRTASE
ncbi:hypothetical protein [Bradyrhizobium sp.]|uniref:hypothetical protein n=1 Tax=Bradyrhizobium sp. TaxID=376 RepID=UPI00238A2FB7|nr:hypothetical protein [Bradyrhizobium sp.]MDE1933506.1 hypothetical protein [Bradyrhizobium sp.]MDE2061210.1 hypothetical protein [Bradyrhizobium sp.]